LRLRRQSPALLSGSYQTLGNHRYVFAYLRRAPNQTVIVALNMSAEKQTLPVVKTALRAQPTLALSSVRSPGQVLQGNELGLAPFEAALSTTPGRALTSGSCPQDGLRRPPYTERLKFLRTVSGHGFSRAVRGQLITAALAAEAHRG